jgi:hypothetical protein
MSPREFSIACEAYRLNQEDELKRDRAHAWHVAVWANQAFAGKLPSFDEAVGNKPAEPQNASQIGAALRMITGHKGRPVKRKKAA